MQRDFSAAGRNELWVADFTYLRCWDGLVFFAFVVDAHSREVVGWQFAAHMRTVSSSTRSAWPLAMTERVDEGRTRAPQPPCGNDDALVQCPVAGRRPALSILLIIVIIIVVLIILGFFGRSRF